MLTLVHPEQVSLLEEKIEPRKKLPHLLVHLRERKPEKLHYIGVSFGLTLELFRFWRKHKFVPFFIGHNPVKMKLYMCSLLYQCYIYLNLWRFICYYLLMD